jgi:hypothetical protein
MRDEIEGRLRELEAELADGQRLEAAMARRLEEVRRDLLRVSGAAQVLEELLNGSGSEQEPAEDGVRPLAAAGA